MGCWQKVVRCIALALFLAAAGDLLADILTLSVCVEHGQAADPTGTDRGQAPQNDCFCCCTHVVPAPPVELAVADVIARVPTTADPAAPAPEPSLIYHPPKA